MRYTCTCTSAEVTADHLHTLGIFYRNIKPYTTNFCICLHTYRLHIECLISIKHNFIAFQEASVYDASQEIDYLDMVIQESLRIYPPGAM